MKLLWVLYCGIYSTDCLVYKYNLHEIGVLGNLKKKTTMLLMSIKLWKYILQAKDLCERLYPIENAIHGNFLVVQWLRFHTFTTKGLGLISGLELRSCKPLGATQKKKKKCNSYF